MGFGCCEPEVEETLADVVVWLYFPVMGGGSFHGHLVEIFVFEFCQAKVKYFRLLKTWVCSSGFGEFSTTQINRNKKGKSEK